MPYSCRLWPQSSPEDRDTTNVCSTFAEISYVTNRLWGAAATGGTVGFCTLSISAMANCSVPVFLPFLLASISGSFSCIVETWKIYKEYFSNNVSESSDKPEDPVMKV